MKRSNNLWVIGEPRGWIVRHEGGFTPLVVCRTEREALTGALELAANSNASIVWQNVEGKIADVWSQSGNNVLVNGAKISPKGKLKKFAYYKI